MGELRVIILTPRPLGRPETFIRAHIERLPGDVRHLYVEPGSLFAAGMESPQKQHARSWDLVRSSVLRRRQKQEDPIVSALRDYLGAEQINVVLAEYGVAGVWAMVACEQAGIPLVVHFHGYDAYKESLLLRLDSEYRQLFASTSAVIAVSQHMAGQLRSLGAPAGKLHVLPYGIDLSQFSGAAPGKTPPRFVAVGRFVNKKAPLLTLFAFRQVVDRVPDAELMMIGDGPLGQAVEQTVRHLGLAGRVCLLGAVSHEDVAAEMRRARAFVQHSIRAEDGDCEGSPVAILEASATGVPVVSTRHTGIPEIIIEGKTGYLVEEGDVDGMAAFMIRLAQDARLAAELGRAGRERAVAQYSMDKSIAALWEVVTQSVKTRAQTVA